ncbi:MAG: thermonuclease family protein [Candidatus Nanopelagicales bacterium]
MDGPGRAIGPLGTGGPAAVPAAAPRGPVNTGWRVSRVVDGDTVWVSRAGTRVKVRLIGIDTPETVDPGEPVGCYGPQASAFAQAELADRAVVLEYDESQGREDRYGRTLAYLWTVGPDGRPERMYQVAALGAGVAREYTYDRPYAWRAEFLAEQAAARAAGRGLWSACPSPWQ